MIKECSYPSDSDNMYILSNCLTQLKLENLSTLVLENKNYKYVRELIRLVYHSAILQNDDWILEQLEFAGMVY